MTAKTKTETSADREIVITRLIDAPLERVWRAWADPAEIVKWWGPHGFSNETASREFKKGGSWRHTMIGPDGTRFPNFAKYLEIVEHEKIVYTNGGGKEGGEGVSFTATVTFARKGGKTELTMRSVFPTAAMRELVAREYKAEEGGRQTLARLEAHVKQDFVVSRLVDAPRARVWKAWTEAKALAAWMGPKGAETISSSKLDLRPGGTYHYGMKAGGVEMWGKLTYKEIVPPEKLVYVQIFSDKDGGLGRHPMAPTWPRHMLTTIVLGDFGPKTLITVYWSPYEASEQELATFRGAMAGMHQGWGGSFERLDEYLAQGAR
jgi:uncharacterized protein YndB with AHSA1/START domain